MLYFGANWLVAGSAGLAAAMRVPALIIGLTVVAYGTSSPEMVVSVQASLAGNGQIAFGNVIGSNIANIGLILGSSIFLKPARTDGAFLRREIPVLLLCAIAVPFLLGDGVISRFEGLLLILSSVAYTAAMVRSARSSIATAIRSAKATEAAAEEAGGGINPTGKLWLALTAFVGLVVLVCGGSLFVNGATRLALAAGISDRVVGLTIVAIGTSLPELITSILAAIKGHSDIAIGNVVGSNIFNICVCLGLAALISPIEVPLSHVSFDLAVMIGFTCIAAFMIRKERVLMRREGIFLLSMYTAFLCLLIFGPTSVQPVP